MKQPSSSFCELTTQYCVVTWFTANPSNAACAVCFVAKSHGRGWAPLLSSWSNAAAASGEAEADGDSEAEALGVGVALAVAFGGVAGAMHQVVWVVVVVIALRAASAWACVG